MPPSDFKIPLATAYPGLESIDTPKGRCLVGDIRTDQGVTRAHIKLLSIEDIAKEALCAVLGRLLDLPVPQPYYVNVDPAITSRALGNSSHMAFALESEPIPAPQLVDDTQLESELQKWPKLYGCAAFDTWVGNRDRLPNNLLYAREADFWMIDHEDALPGYLRASDPVGSQLIKLIAQDKTEHKLYQERNELMKCVAPYKSLNWDDIRGYLQYGEIDDGEKYFKRHITFLAERTQYMRKILTEELGIRQGNISFQSGSENADDIVR